MTWRSKYFYTATPTKALKGWVLQNPTGGEGEALVYLTGLFPHLPREQTKRVLAAHFQDKEPHHD